MDAAYAIETELVSGLSRRDEARYLEEFAPLVKRAAYQLAAQAGTVMDRDDMIQLGLMGLLDALRRYGIPDATFPGYAMTRIRGAILDELRRLDWRPRTVRQESHRLRDQIRAMTRRLGREPNEREVMDALGIDSDAYQAHVLAETAETLASFDEVLHEAMAVPDEGDSPEAQWLRKRSLEQALKVLDSREQQVIQLYYEFDLNLKEIAAVLELTEARISQINKSALQKMKTFLQAAEAA